MKKRTIKKLMRRFVRYIRKTMKYKLYGIVLIILGIVSSKVMGESTGLVICWMLGIPLCFLRLETIQWLEELED